MDYDLSHPFGYYHDNRIELIRIREMIQRHQVSNASFMMNLLPYNLHNWTIDISDSYDINPDFVLLSILGGIAGSDRGHHHIVNENGQDNILGLFVCVSAPSGEGKSSAMQIILDIFKEYEKIENENFIQRENKIEAKRLILEAEKQEALDEAIISCDTSRLETIIGELKQIKENKLQPVRIFVNDVTAPAFAKTMESQGYVNLFDPDGVSWNENVYRQVAKYWAGEGHAELRISRQGSCVREPFVNAVVFTQPEFFRKTVMAETQRAMGITARSILYAAPPYRKRGMGKPIDERIKDELRQKLMNLFNASKPDTQGNTPPTKYLRVGTGAAKILNEFDQEMRSEVNLNGNGARIRDWCVRASQQALRIAGIFHLCENDVPSESLISEREMGMAVRFIRVVYEHVKASVLFDADRETELCILKIAEWCCSANRAAKVTNKEIKDAMRSKFRAAKVDIAISWLVDYGALEVLPLTEKHGPGRPVGAWYLNRMGVGRA